jgi:hypothetical protein
MRAIALLLIAALCLQALFAAPLDDKLAEADRLYDADRAQEAQAVLEAALKLAANGKERAEVYWRISRVLENIGLAAREEKKPQIMLLGTFQAGEQNADKAIAEDKNSYQGYYWKSANMGRWAETKGILDSLFKAGPMKDACTSAIRIKPDFEDAYFVLCQLYTKAPGWPLSFGDPNIGVSFGRYAVELRARQFASGEEKSLSYDFMMELGNALWSRNWDAAKRVKEQAAKKAVYEAKSDPFDKYSNYEGAAAIDPKLSDREEAALLLREARKGLEAIKAPTKSERAQLNKALKYWKDWGLK